MLDLDFLGIDLAGLNDGAIAAPEGDGNVLLYDGDGACYTHSAGVKNIETCYRRLEKDILTMMYLTNCDHSRVHLTPKGCHKNGRHLLLGVKGYQDNRGSNKKPELLEELRDGAAYHFRDHPTITIIPQYQIEADDGLIIDAYQLKNGILISPDKDLNLNPYKDYVVGDGVFRKLPDGDTFGWVKRKDWLTPSGRKSSKMVGKGIKFFLAQCLMGDTADNVAGILKLDGKQCGMVGALNALEPITCPHEAVNRVIGGYREIDQNIAPEAEAMWLLRTLEDSSYKLFNEYELTTENKQFLDDCYLNRKWKMTEGEYDELQRTK